MFDTFLCPHHGFCPVLGGRSVGKSAWTQLGGSSSFCLNVATKTQGCIQKESPRPLPREFLLEGASQRGIPRTVSPFFLPPPLGGAQTARPLQMAPSPVGASGPLQLAVAWP